MDINAPVAGNCSGLTNYSPGVTQSSDNTAVFGMFGISYTAIKNGREVSLAAPACSAKLQCVNGPCAAANSVVVPTVLAFIAIMSPLVFLM